MFDRAELLAYIFENSEPTFRSKEVDVLVMTEECVYVVRLSQDVSTPAVQHNNLQEGCEVFRFVAEKQMAGCFMKQTEITITLPEFVIQMSVLAASPDTPLRNPYQRRTAVHQRASDPMRKIENAA
jgi:hypothetical protein